MTYQQGGPQPPVPPENLYSSQGQHAGGQVSYSADPQTQSDSKGYQTGFTEPVYTQSTQETQPVEPNHKKKKFSFSWKTFLTAFCGALFACVLALGVYSVVHPGGSSTVLGGSGGSITVNGEDTTLAEAVSQKCLPSVVNIDVYTQTSSQSFMGMVDQSGEEYTESSLGSGIIISSDGYILTNYHVIEDADRLQVTADGGEYEAQVVGTDPSSDLAVLKIDATDLTAIEIGSSSDLTVGEWVMALGSPYGLEQSVSTGIVSATSRTTTELNSDTSSAVYTNLIQTDAAINPGNSGGALVDKDGKLIGVNTLIASSSGSSSGVGFAIPVDYAINIAQQIIDGKQPSHAQLGVSATTVTSQLAERYGLGADSGAYISQVNAGSSAEQAGLQQGDIVTKLGDTDITSSSDLVLAVRSHNVGDTVTITYVRDGAENTAEVTLGSDS